MMVYYPLDGRDYHRFSDRESASEWVRTLEQPECARLYLSKHSEPELWSLEEDDWIREPNSSSRRRINNSNSILLLVIVPLLLLGSFWIVSGSINIIFPKDIPHGSKIVSAQVISLENVKKRVYLGGSNPRYSRASMKTFCVPTIRYIEPSGVVPDEKLETVSWGEDCPWVLNQTYEFLVLEDGIVLPYQDGQSQDQGRQEGVLRLIFGALVLLFAVGVIRGKR